MPALRSCTELPPAPRPSPEDIAAFAAAGVSETDLQFVTSERVIARVQKLRAGIEGGHAVAWIDPDRALGLAFRDPPGSVRVVALPDAGDAMNVAIDDGGSRALALAIHSGNLYEVTFPTGRAVLLAPELSRPGEGNVVYALAYTAHNTVCTLTSNGVTLYCRRDGGLEPRAFHACDGEAQLVATCGGTLVTALTMDDVTMLRVERDALEHIASHAGEFMHVECRAGRVFVEQRTPTGPALFEIVD